MKIVITDSGLGGLSVMAELERRLKKYPIFENVDLVFFNSLYSSEFGYNSMKSFSKKVITFNNALNSILLNYNPDLILIACNTLSVLYPHTKLVKKTKTVVKGILNSGVSLFKESIQSNNKIILFGTPTTINSNVYEDALVECGVSKTQIINIACQDLETEIQNDPNGSETLNSITKFVKKGVDLIDTIPQKIYAGFCCTHYGYSEISFYEELSKQLSCKVEILNPNNKMIDFLFEKSKKTYDKCNVTVKIVSQVRLKRNEIERLSKILGNNSPMVADALRHYEFNETLFEKG